MAVKTLLFVDANIWLDFYRARTEAALSFLRHLEQIKDRIIVTYLLEMEFKKNRQNALIEGMQELKAPQGISRPGFFSDAKEIKAMHSAAKQASVRIGKLKARMTRALATPTTHDPVFRACQRIFHKADGLVLSREDRRRRLIRRNAFRRFLLGYPPRKKADTSMGDAFNWEWMLACAIEHNAELVIVTRDADYGVLHDGQPFLNDHLRQEFSERVSRKRKVHLFAKLSEALKLFQVKVTAAEEAEEQAAVTRLPLLMNQEAVAEILKELASVFDAERRARTGAIGKASIELGELLGTPPPKKPALMDEIADLTMPPDKKGEKQRAE